MKIDTNTPFTRIELLREELRHMVEHPGNLPLSKGEDHEEMVEEVFDMIFSSEERIQKAIKAKEEAEKKLNTISKELENGTAKDGAAMMNRIAQLVDVAEVAEVKAWRKDQTIAKLKNKIRDVIKLLDQSADKKTAGFVRGILSE